MIHCEQFESQFKKWRDGLLSPADSDDMRVHHMTCPYCVSYNEELVGLREQIAHLPGRVPRSGFELRLKNRLQNRAGLSRQPVSRVPRWAALGAGLALGVVIGLIAVIPYMQSRYGAPSLSPGVNVAAEQPLKGAAAGVETATPASRTGDGGLVAQASPNADSSAEKADSVPRSATGYDPDLFSHTVSADH